MRCIFGVLCVYASLGVLPQSGVAQTGDAAVSKLTVAMHTQHRLPSQLMLRASYLLYLDADEEGRSRVERWHPEAFVGPSEPKPTSAPEERGEVSLPVYTDPVSGAPLAGPGDTQVPMAPPAEEQDRRRRRIGIGVGVSVGVVVVLAVLGGVAAAGLRDL